ncbi:MBL fold metallo-hydrolase [Candidatus Marsarchaeota archaeon]|nr:MBL fold metallo-hydrolase [Candidatus Marsarchaeota archaeon]MCL5404940.1 MBL fold metallo-hydrolase [Candidatus Marsarchaeota archaeon]
MKISFFGGAHEVGRSAILLEDRRKLMLDYGAKVEDEIAYPVAMPNIDACILSHAHLDHSGAVAALYNDMSIPTIGTEPTLKLTELLLNDSLKIARKEHKRINFHKKQLNKFTKHYMSTGYSKQLHIGDFDIELFDAGHIAGSSLIRIERSNAKYNKRIVYTGDFKMAPQYMHEGAKPVKSDVLIIESTYATREHPDRQKLVKEFVEKVKEVIDNGGTALVPAFAVGRSQELLVILYKNGLADKVYMDGMAREATSIVMSNPKFIRDPSALSKAVNQCNMVEGIADRKEALEGGSIILTTAGMLNGGPVMNYITKLNKESMVFLTGYQVEGTNGRKLIDTGKIYIEESDKEIKPNFGFYDFSAHAGMNDLYKFVRESAPNIVICVHGSPENTESFAENLKGEGFEAYAPKVGDKLEIKDV